MICYDIILNCQDGRGYKVIEGEGQNICTNASIHTYIYEYIYKMQTAICEKVKKVLSYLCAII